MSAFAATGVMDPQLEVELQAMNVVATCEQRNEEVHSRIWYHNARAGRRYRVPATSAKVRMGEHMQTLSDWRPACS